MYGKVLLGVFSFGVIMSGLYMAYPNQIRGLMGSPQFSAPVEQGGFDTDSAARLVFNMVNEERQKAGLNAVQWDDDLAELGRNHARDMITRGYYDHNTPEGLTPNDRAKESGYNCFRAPYYGVAENLAEAGPAFGQSTPESMAKTAMSDWMNSPLHKQNILTANHAELGVGVYVGVDGSGFVVQEFC